MSVLVRKKKKTLKECDMADTCGGDGGMVTPSGNAFANAATNIGGMGNPIPPQENSFGSGDNFGGSVAKVSTQAPALKMKQRFKVRKKKS